MGFSSDIVEKALVASNRCCCICHKSCGTKIELHHIVQKADDGDDIFENCIPLCFDCHAEVASYNPHHPKGRKFTKGELIKHRDTWYAKVANSITKTSDNADITLSTGKLNKCSRCGFGYYVNNPFGEYSLILAMFDATATCPRCGNVDKVN
jgi:hypothetical protein